MPGETIFHSHSRKGALTCFPTFRFSPNDILHGLKLAKIPCASTAWGQASINSGVAVQVAKERDANAIYTAHLLARSAHQRPGRRLAPADRTLFQCEPVVL